MTVLLLGACDSDTDSADSESSPTATVEQVATQESTPTESATPTEAATTAPATATPTATPTATEAEELNPFGNETVADFFAGKCAACHGADRQGIVGPALLPERLTESDEFYFDTIKGGRAGTPMPAWGAAGVTDEQIEALVQFIKS